MISLILMLPCPEPEKIHYESSHVADRYNQQKPFS